MIKAGAYVHIPFCRKKCDYCAFVSRASEVSEEYLSALIGEITRSEHTDLVFDTVFMGGGTPSLLPDGVTTRILDAIRTRFKTELVEVTVEGNPESMTEAKLAELKSAGVNRISMGVQSLDDACLRAVGRVHDKRVALRALESACKHFDNVSVDMMLGLPSRANLAMELDDLVQFPVKHVSAYMLTVEDGTKLSSAVKACEVTLPTEDDAVDEYELVHQKLQAIGMHRYEVSNFATPGYECKHNLKYWRRKPYLGFGVSAHSCVGNERFFNVESIEEYELGKTVAGKEIIDEKTAMFETVMLGLRLDEGVSRKAFYKAFGKDICDVYHNNIARVKDALVVDDEAVRVKSEYTCVLNSLLVEFMD